MKIGVLALQGAVAEHIKSLQQAGADEVVPVKWPADLEGLDGLVLPGGESTTIGKLMNKYELMEPVREMAERGVPMFGTCAGLILLANRIEGQDWAHLGVFDVLVNRNSFGRQVDSFETDLEVKDMEGDEKYTAVFIRAPHIIEVGDQVEVLSTFNDRVVTARQGHIIGASFHPELTDDVRLHKYFLKMVDEAKQVRV
ncbi:pyridoxal 5'-phosphate synthase glutaminase subunit PdxT [Tumebacillus permanentifrigoris]|uniref:Pyridoxal 5'-phosphate synthase subunit PdxT n=1 Tax=Tumebacillus permanentifrigoris TaxID=378543 RepID=A0A316D2L0_9BACL|nr:pyridoxal 5'-phosphate synthase glutaminase subunit PdxT [Tumebacillus permanentifrigoris]PWK05140.1 pyridoxal phosphate synthase yaaE subunit [Tumebacillus permanentifrigoris]